MRFTYTIGLVGVLLGCIVWPTVSQATHVRAGEITTKRVSATTLTYEITFTAYFDYQTGRAAADMGEEYTICFGDGTSALVKRLTPTFINGRTSTINIYRVRHTFPGPNPYTISVTVPNRNEGTKNLPPPGNSDDIRFFVSTTILINPGLGLNSTPVLLNPPLDSGRVGQRFTHNPAAFDADGDSLAFRLSIPKEGIGDLCPRFRDIPAYQDPTRFSRNAEAGGTPSFAINPVTGELAWDAPGEEGQYNFAFIVEEWRNGVLIGEVTRDMQIVVVDSPNKRPLILPIPELCVEAGTLINQPITATDPDGQRVIISGFGGVFNVGADGQPLPPGELIAPDYARLNPTNTPLAQPATATFRWQTNCNQVRETPYDVVFKVTDVPPRPTPALVSFQTLRIRIVGPAVKNLTARPTASAGGRAIQLSWDPYTCGPAGSVLIIYRREGCTDIPIPACFTGLPPNSGYQEVARVPLGTTTYTDTAALRRGTSYSYRLVAEYQDRNGQFVNGGVSVASGQACLELPLLVPVMTQVTVDSTSQTRGRITVRWSRPIGLQPGDLAGPYQYRLQRATGLSGTDWTTITTVNTSLGAGQADTVYVDRGSSTSALNTVANAYRYRVEFYYTDGGQLTRLDVTEAASSVRLSAAAAQRQVRISWVAAVPWSNDNQLHDVYRSRTGPQGPFNQIATVGVQGPPTYSFTDNGGDAVGLDGNTSLALSADSSYCYRVLTRGRYGDSRLGGLGLLENYSQILCAQPSDTTRPCAPRLGLDSLNCAGLSNESFCTQPSFTNQLRWQATAGPTCDPNIASYKLYYGRYRQDTLGVLASIAAPTTSFAHTNLTTVAGCYYVTAVSVRGLESDPSNKVCNDGCPYFALPNVFTPNGDGKNDVFQPMRCARFVESLELIVYNRWGAKVYEYRGGVLSWNGKTGDGADLPSGQYYYQVSVRFGLLDRSSPAQVFKGWVQILREGVSMR